MPTTDGKLLLVTIFAVVSLAATLLLEPIPQDLSYHAFADTRTMFGIPNALDVLSNIPFLIVGAYSLACLFRMDAAAWHPAWAVLFVGVFLVGFGSSFYHLAPDNSTLVWDRLPMTIGFMGLFVAVLSEFSAAKLGYGFLTVAVLTGASSVLYWAVTDDLRFYAWVQFMPLVTVIILLIAYGSRYTHSWLLGLALSMYVAAKLAEHFDHAIFNALAQSVSGHTLKHLFAASGCYAVLLFLLRRKQLS